jgi:hypothetical protein
MEIDDVEKIEISPYYQEHQVKVRDHVTIVPVNLHPTSCTYHMCKPFWPTGFELFPYLQEFL